MEGFSDKTRLFKDFNFKLVVIDALLSKEPAFMDDLNALVEKYSKSFEYHTNAGPIKELMEYFSDLKLEPADLDKVTELCFDGGNEIYSYIQPDWDGEDDFFDVTSIGGFERLNNLDSVVYISMIQEKLLEPMRKKGINIE